MKVILKKSPQKSTIFDVIKQNNNESKAREIISKFSNEFLADSTYNSFLRSYNEVIVLTQHKGDKLLSIKSKNHMKKTNSVFIFDHHKIVSIWKRFKIATNLITNSDPQFYFSKEFLDIFKLQAHMKFCDIINEENKMTANDAGLDNLPAIFEEGKNSWTNFNLFDAIEDSGKGS